MYGSSQSTNRSSTLRVKIADAFRPSEPPPLTTFSEPPARKPKVFDLTHEHNVAEGIEDHSASVGSQAQQTVSSESWQEQLSTYQQVLGLGNAAKEAVVMAMTVVGQEASQDEILECAQTYLNVKEFIPTVPSYRIAGAMVRYGHKQQDIQPLSSALLDAQ